MLSCWRIFDNERTYAYTAWMDTSAILGGFADARLADGTSARLMRTDAGWLPILRGVEVDAPQATWEAALYRLQHVLAGERILLRAAG